MQEQQKIAAIHGKGEQYMEVGGLYDAVAVKVWVADVHGYASVDNHTANHLQELESGDKHVDPFWRSADPTSSKGVVCVHEGVHEVVHHHEPLHRGNHVGVVVPAVGEDSDVVVPVEEDELLLAKHNEECVYELWKLREAKEERPHTCLMPPQRETISNLQLWVSVSAHCRVPAFGEANIEQQWGCGDE